MAIMARNKGLKYFILPIMAILLISIVVGIIILIKERNENE